MNAQTTTNLDLVPVAERLPAVAVGARGILISSLADLLEFARMVSASGLAPKGMDRPEQVAIAVQYGLEIGLSPMQSVQNIAVIGNRPGIWGDAALALCRASGLVADFDEWMEVAGQRVDEVRQWADDTTAVCMSARKGGRKRIHRFSVAMAKQAGLWGKKNRDGSGTPWTFHPARMLQMRARSFNLRDQFPDVLKGLYTVEELRDEERGPKEVEVEVTATSSLPQRGVGEGDPQAASSARRVPEPAPEPAPAAFPEEQSTEPRVESGEPAGGTSAAESYEQYSKLYEHLREDIDGATTVEQLRTIWSELSKQRVLLGETPYQSLAGQCKTRAQELKTIAELS